MIKESKHVPTKKINKVQKKIARDKKRDKTIWDRQKTMNKVVIVSPFLSVVALNVNGLDSLIKDIE